MKTLFSNNWIELELIKGILFGIAENSGIILFMVGPIALSIDTGKMFKRKRKNRPSKF